MEKKEEADGQKDGGMEEWERERKIESKKKRGRQAVCGLCV